MATARVVAVGTVLLCACAIGRTDDAGDVGHADGRADAGRPAQWPDAGPPLPTAPDAGNPVVGGPPATCTTIPAYAGGFEVIECVPETTAGPAGLVVVLHGYTQSAAELLDTTEWDVLAGRYGFYVVFPQAPGNRAWYWYTAGRSRGQADPAGLVAIVDAMKAEHAIDDGRVFAAGLSAGGYMAVNLLADYPDVFAAGSATSGGAHGCSALCASVPSGGANVAAVTNELPAWWSDPATPKPPLLLLHGDLDATNVPGNSEQLVLQWTGAHGADQTPDNAALGLPTEINGYPYEAYARDDGAIAVARIRMTDLGHGTPVNPGEGVDQGGHDPMPSSTASDCFVCPQDWTNTGSLYGPYYEAVFFGLVP